MEVSQLQAAKLAIMSLTELSRDALHVHAGLLVFVMAAVILRKSFASPWPWMVTMGVACGMEVLDAVDGILSVGHWWLRASVHDVLNTMAWPTLLALLCRYTRLAGRNSGDAPGQTSLREPR